MNKRFSTLLAAVLVAGGLSTTAMAAAGPVDDSKLESGDFTYLANSDEKLVIGSDQKTLETKDFSSAPTTLAGYDAALWKITKIKKTSQQGDFNVYQFRNKATNQLLAVKLQTAPTTAASAGAASVSANVAVLDGAGNSEWRCDQEKGLYISKGDSTFYFDGLKLAAVKGTIADVTAGAKPLTFSALTTSDKVVLTADLFNELVKKTGGKLFFNNSKNVSTGEENILTKYSWEAIQGEGVVTASAPKLFLAAKGKTTSINKAPYLLMVDSLYSDDVTPAYNKLTVDTLAAAPAADGSNFAALAAVVKKINKKNTTTRPVGTAQFTATLFLKNDSVALAALQAPKVIGSTKFFYTGDASTAMASDDLTGGNVVLRKLSNTVVLTVSTTTSLAGYIEPLIQPYATQSMGGTAEITPNKIYYVADMRTWDASNNKANPYYGKFYDYNFPNQAKYLNEGQAFNVFSQFVVFATPGTDKGSYTIKTRYSGKTAWTGVADSLENGNIVFGSDTIKLVDANIEYKGETQYIGYHATDFALKNKQFKIQSASPLLGEDMFIHMKKDSSMTLKAGEVLYTLDRINVVPNEDAAIEDAVDPLAWDVYAIKTSKGEYLIMDANGNYALTADPEKYNYTVSYNYETSEVATKSFIATGFTFIPTEAADKYVIMPVFPRVKVAADQTKKLNEIAVSCEYSSVPGQTAENATVVSTPVPDALKNSMITVNTNSGDLENSLLGKVKYDLFYVAEEDDPQSLFTMPKHIQIETTNNQFVTVNAKNEALVVAENALKAANYTAEDFTFWLDTAKYNRNGETVVTPEYYVTRGVAADTTTKVDAHRLYMYNAADSAANATVNKEQYTAFESARVIFREAQRYGADSLIVAGDTLTIDGKKTTVIAKPKAGVNDFRFNFLQAKDEATGVYNIKNGDKYLRNLNGVLVIGEAEEAAMVTVNAAEAPTANEGVEVSEVTVIAQNGAVRIANAEGKKVVITNILGQTIANTVITSSDAVIAAPAGVVVVAVEGEEAVKAIVK